MLMGVLVLSTSGCATGEGSSAPLAGADGRSQAATSRDNDAPPDFDDVAAEMSRSLLGGQRVQGARGGSAAVVSVERFVNHTRVSEKDFDSFRRDFVKGLRDSGRAWGLLFEPAAASRAGRYELHAAVMPIGGGREDQWLVRMLVLGPGESGGRQTLWSDTLLTRAR